MIFPKQRNVEGSSIMFQGTGKWMPAGQIRCPSLSFRFFAQIVDPQFLAKSNSVIKQHLLQRKNDLRPPPERLFRALFDFLVKSMSQATQDTFISKIH